MTVSPIITGLGSRAKDLIWSALYAPAGIYTGVSEGVQVGRTAAAVTNTIGGAGALTGANHPKIAAVVFDFLRKTIGSLFAGGVSGIRTSGIVPALGNALQTLKFGNLAPVLKACGGRGIALLAAHPIVAGAAIILGATLAYSEYKKVDDIQKGMNMDPVNSSLIHGLHSLAGVGTVLGGLLMFTPAGVGVGLATIAASFAGAKVMDFVEWLKGGVNMFNYANLAPWPLNNLIGSFKKPGIEQAYIA